MNTAPKGLFPPEPVPYKGPKLKVAIIGAGLAGMSTAVELLDQGHEVFTPLLLVVYIFDLVTYMCNHRDCFRWIYMIRGHSLVAKWVLL